MLLGTNDLKNQQQILAALGFYRGAIDGIWSTATMEAKVAFERTKEFKPAIPNNGLPFQRGDRLPVTIVRQRDGNLWCAKLEEYLKSLEPKPEQKAERQGNKNKEQNNEPQSEQ